MVSSSLMRKKLFFYLDCDLNTFILVTCLWGLEAVSSNLMLYSSLDQLPLVTVRVFAFHEAKV